jgi:hypothetical protein
MQQLFMFSQVPFNWNPTKKAFISPTGNLNLAIFNKEVVARVVKGYIVLDKTVNARQKNSKPKLYIYFEIDRDWYFFKYDGTYMWVGTTNTNFEEEIVRVTAKSSKLGIMRLSNERTPGSKALTKAELEKKSFFTTYFPKDDE